MLRRVALVRTDISEELRALYFFAACVGCYIRVTLFLAHLFLSP
jgi:hypothetical protein